MDVDKVSQTTSCTSNLQKQKRTTPTTPVDNEPSHLGSDLCQIDDYKVVYTKTADNLKRRAIVLVKENNTWGFTLQTYGIHHKATKEVEMLTYVDYVAFDGPAHKAGMRAGDVILSINGESMESVDHPALVDHIMKCEEKIRMVVFFEDCVRKVEMHQRIIKLQKVLEDKEKELLALEEQERDIIEGIAAHEASSSSETEASEEEIVERRRGNVTIEVTQSERIGESPARRASQLGNQFIQMFGSANVASTSVGAVSPQPQRSLKASPSFGRRVLKRQKPLDKGNKKMKDMRKISPRLDRKEFTPISSSDESEDESPYKTVKGQKIEGMAPGELSKSGLKGEGVGQAQGELTPNTPESDDSVGLQVIVNKKAAAVLGLCDMTPESQKVRKTSGSSSQALSLNQEPGEVEGSIPKSESKTSMKSDADLTVSKKAARFLGLCEPELESKKPHRSRSANEKDMQRPNSEIFKHKEHSPRNVRPQSQFFIGKPGEDEDGDIFVEQKSVKVVERRRSSQFYITLEDIGVKETTTDSVHPDQVEGTEAKFDDEENEQRAGKVGAKSKPRVITSHRSTSDVLGIGKSSSLGELFPMKEDAGEGQRFVRAQSETTEPAYMYGSLGRKRHKKKKHKDHALVHSQSICTDVHSKHGTSHLGEVPKQRSHSSGVVDVLGVGANRVQLGEVVIGTGVKSAQAASLGTPMEKHSPRLSPRMSKVHGTPITRTAPWGEGELEKTVDRLRLVCSTSDVESELAKGRKRATSHQTKYDVVEHSGARSKSESDVAAKAVKKNKSGFYVVAVGPGYSPAEMEIPVFEEPDSNNIQLVRYEKIDEYDNSEENFSPKHYARQMSESLDFAAQTSAQFHQEIDPISETVIPTSATSVEQNREFILAQNETGCDIFYDSGKSGIPVSNIEEGVGDDCVFIQGEVGNENTCDASEETSKNLEEYQVRVLHNQPLSSTIIEEEEPINFSYEGIRLGELINEDDEITWL